MKYHCLLWTSITRTYPNSTQMVSDREEILIWDSNGSLNNMFGYRFTKSKLPLICSRICLGSIQKTAVRKTDLLVKTILSFPPRKALWPCFHLVWSSLKSVSQSAASAVCWFSLQPVLVTKPGSSWRKQNPLVTPECTTGTETGVRVGTNDWSLRWLQSPCVMLKPALV